MYSHLSTFWSTSSHLINVWCNLLDNKLSMNTRFESFSMKLFWKKELDANLCKFILCALCIALPQRSNIHLLGLFSHIFFMSRYSCNDEPVAVTDEDEWQEVDKEAVWHNVRSGKPVLGEVVGAACSQITLRDVAKAKDLYYYAFT